MKSAAVVCRAAALRCWWAGPDPKTLFALQFLVHGAQDCGEPGMSDASPAPDRQMK